ncbi:MAG: phosphatase PAP2 family protein [bacterium]
MSKFLNKRLWNYFLIGLFLVCLLVFIKITEEVWSKESVIGYDQRFSNWIFSFRNANLNTFFKLVTDLADVKTIFALLGIVLLISIIYRKRIFPILMGTTVVVNFMIVEVVKLIIARPRPLVINALVLEDSFSFPSGHALIAITFYGMLILYLCLKLKSSFLKVITFLTGILLILAIGFSRIYLGVHWLSDVTASFLIGSCWLIFVSLLAINLEFLVKQINRFKWGNYLLKLLDVTHI